MKFLGRGLNGLVEMMTDSPYPTRRRERVRVYDSADAPREIAAYAVALPFPQHPLRNPQQHTRLRLLIT